MSQPKKHRHKDTYYNDIALRLGHRLFGLEHLHYGYFQKGLKPILANVSRAQREYVKNLLTFIPRGVVRIFDVGCGSGGVATQLVKKKYQVICLAPDPFLTAKTEENTGGRVTTITDYYENVTDLPAESFDLILMSESCQYIKIREGWAQNRRFLRPGGYVLIADFFRIRPLDRPGLSKSGHPLEEFLREAEAHGFKLLRRRDITPQVAPTMDIYQEMIHNRVFPVAEALFEMAQRRFPLLYRFLKRILGKRVERLRLKYSQQDSRTFSTYKGYFVLLFQKNATAHPL